MRQETAPPAIAQAEVRFAAREVGRAERPVIVQQKPLVAPAQHRAIAWVMQQVAPLTRRWLAQSSQHWPQSVSRFRRARVCQYSRDQAPCVLSRATPGDRRSEEH